jgi:hypothetical protein
MCRDPREGYDGIPTCQRAGTRLTLPADPGSKQWISPRRGADASEDGDADRFSRVAVDIAMVLTVWLNGTLSFPPHSTTSLLRGDGF